MLVKMYETKPGQPLQGFKTSAAPYSRTTTIATPTINRQLRSANESPESQASTSIIQLSPLAPSRVNLNGAVYQFVLLYRYAC